MLVELHRRGNVAVIELRRPERRNAISPGLAADFAAVARQINEDRSIRAAVLAGAGPSFCAGADMKERLSGADASHEVFLAVRRTSWATHEIEIPVVGTAQGHALGAGLEILAMCDYRIAEAGTVLGLPEVRQGITSGGGLLALSQTMRSGALARLAFGGRTLDALQAQAAGIVDEVAEPGEGLGLALERAGEFAQHAREALVATKRALRASLQPGASEQWDLLGSIQESVQGTDAQRDALRGLTPRWAGGGDGTASS